MKNRKTQLTGFTAPHILSGLESKAPILLALSGGADSRALLDILLEYCKEQGTPLSVAHVNHMIRGKDAERDRDFCADLAKRHGIPFYLLEADVPALAKEHGHGLEEEARTVRYDFFAKIMRENSIPLLATAHNATDNAETVIFNIARGSGLKGLCGIPPTRDFDGGKIIRPLLGMSKDEILQYCEDNKLKYVTDGTNSDVTYSRNRIRNNILPELLEINENAIANIGRMSELVREDEIFIDGEAQYFIESLENRRAVPIERLMAQKKSIVARVISALLGEFFRANAVHISDVAELAEKAIPHSRIDLPCGVTVAVENGNLCILSEEKFNSPIDFDIKLSPGENLIEGLDMTVLVKSTENSDNAHNRLKNIYKKSTSTFISSDKIENGSFIRPRREGDKILCGGMHKKLKKLFCEKKIPLDMRAKLPIFYDNNGIFWVPTVAIRDGEKNPKEKIEITLFYN